MKNYKITAGDRDYSITDIDGILYISQYQRDVPFGEVLGCVDQIPSQGIYAKGSNLGQKIYSLTIGNDKIARERLLSKNKNVSQGRFPMIRPLKDHKILLVLPAIKMINTAPVRVPLEERARVPV